TKARPQADEWVRLMVGDEGRVEEEAGLVSSTRPAKSAELAIQSFCGVANILLFAGELRGTRHEHRTPSLFCTRVVTIGEHAVDFEAPSGPLYIAATWVRLGCVLKFVLPRFAALCLR